MGERVPISFRGVTKSYRDFLLRRRTPALSGFSLELQAGQIVGLLGPNGSGKSTALGLCVGLLRPDQGEVRLFGVNPRQAKARRILGYLPEENANLPSLTARQIVSAHGRLCGLSRRDAEARCKQLLEQVGLGDAMDRRSRTFSKGMRRRLGLAQCLVGSPKVLVLDEPTSGLDPVATELMRDILLQARKEGVSVLLSSHLLAEIEDICDHLVVLRQGQTILEGDSKELLRHSDLREVRFRCLSEAKEQALRAWAREQDLSIEEVRIPNRSLADFYREHVNVAEGQAE